MNWKVTAAIATLAVMGCVTAPAVKAQFRTGCDGLNVMVTRDGRCVNLDDWNRPQATQPTQKVDQPLVFNLNLTPDPEYPNAYVRLIGEVRNQSPQTISASAATIALKYQEETIAKLNEKVLPGRLAPGRTYAIFTRVPLSQLGKLKDQPQAWGNIQLEVLEYE